MSETVKPYRIAIGGDTTKTVCYVLDCPTLKSPGFIEVEVDEYLIKECPFPELIIVLNIPMNITMLRKREHGEVSFQHTKYYSNVLYRLFDIGKKIRFSVFLTDSLKLVSSETKGEA